MGWIVSGLCKLMVCVKGWFVFYHSLYYISSHKPSLCTKPSLQTNHPLHTNHPFTKTIQSHKPFNILHSITQTIPSPSYHTNKPLHNPFIILCITYYLVCVKGWIQVTEFKPSHKPTLHTNHLTFSLSHSFTSHKPDNMYYIPPHKPDNM